jgi:hypothetical protein
MGVVSIMQRQLQQISQIRLTTITYLRIPHLLVRWECLVWCLNSSKWAMDKIFLSCTLHRVTPLSSRNRSKSKLTWVLSSNSNKCRLSWCNRHRWMTIISVSSNWMCKTQQTLSITCTRQGSTSTRLVGTEWISTHYNLPLETTRRGRYTKISYLRSNSNTRQIWWLHRDSTNSH